MRCRILSIGAVLWSLGCRGGPDVSAPPPPPQVTVTEVRREELAERDDYQGEFEAIDAAALQPDIEHDERGAAAAQRLERLVAVARAAHLMTIVFEDARDEIANVGFVVYDENVGRH